MSSRVCTVACLGQEMEKDKADKVAARLAKKAEAAARRESAEPPSAPRTPGLLASELPVALAIPLPSPEPPMATPMTPAPITTPAPNAEGPPTGMPTGTPAGTLAMPAAGAEREKRMRELIRTGPNMLGAVDPAVQAQVAAIKAAPRAPSA